MVERASGAPEVLPSKAADVPLRAGDVFVLRTSGGGGLGLPTARDPALVLADVLAGRVTVEGAARDYGVALDAAGSAVDEGRSRELRAERA